MGGGGPCIGGGPDIGGRPCMGGGIDIGRGLIIRFCPCIGWGGGKLEGGGMSAGGLYSLFKPDADM